VRQPVGNAVNAVFPKTSRLLHPAAFAATFAARKRVRRGYLLVVWAPRQVSHPEVLESARLGLAISKRHAPTAVLRNRVKRQVREAFRQHVVRGLPIDCVVQLTESIRRRTILAKEWREMAEATFSALLQQAKV
jgi:ribonuclease P protein component